MRSRAIKVIVAVVMAVTVALLTMPMSFAADVVTSGKCGETATWSFNEATGELKIEGTGVVERPSIWEEQFDESGDTPAAATLKSVVIADGITDISTVSFQGCFSLTKITVPATVTGSLSGAFVNQTGVKEVVFKGTAAQWNDLVADDPLMGAEEVKITCSDKVIEPTKTEEADDTATGETTTKPAEETKESKDGGNMTMIIAIGAGAVVVVIIAVVAVVLKKKKN